MPKPVIVLITAALASIIGFATGAILTKADRQAVKTAIDKTKAIRDDIENRLRLSTNAVNNSTALIKKLRKQNSILTQQLKQVQKSQQAQIPHPQSPASIIPFKEWHGSGTKITELFTITKSPWKLRWKVEPHSNFGESKSISISVSKNVPNQNYPSTISTILSQKLGWHESWIYKHGTFYLDITSMFCDWTICIIIPESNE